MAVKKATKKTVATVDSKDVTNEMLDRISALEASNKSLGKAFKQSADALKGAFGLNTVHAIFAELAKMFGK
jgi:hypothetical protein